MLIRLRGRSSTASSSSFAQKIFGNEMNEHHSNYLRAPSIFVTVVSERVTEGIIMKRGEGITGRNRGWKVRWGGGGGGYARGGGTYFGASGRWASAPPWRPPLRDKHREREAHMIRGNTSATNRKGRITDTPGIHPPRERRVKAARESLMLGGTTRGGGRLTLGGGRGCCLRLGGGLHLCAGVGGRKRGAAGHWRGGSHLRHRCLQGETSGKCFLLALVIRCPSLEVSVSPWSINAVRTVTPHRGQ